MTENDVKADIKKYLDMNGYFHYPNVQNFTRNNRGMNGVSDRTAIKGGLVIWIEIKKPGGKIRPSQKVFMERILDAGGYCCCVDSVEQLHNYIRGIR